MGGGGTYGAFLNDKNLETKGVWLDYGEGIGKFLLARAGGSNKRYTKRLQALTKQHRRAIAAETMDEDTGHKILVQVYAQAVIMDWKGVTGRDGKTLRFSADNAEKLLMDLPDLFNAIQEDAQRQILYRDQIKETDAGN